MAPKQKKRKGNKSKASKEKAKRIAVKKAAAKAAKRIKLRNRCCRSGRIKLERKA